MELIHEIKIIERIDGEITRRTLLLNGQELFAETTTCYQLGQLYGIIEFVMYLDGTKKFDSGNNIGNNGCKGFGSFGGGMLKGFNFEPEFFKVLQKQPVVHGKIAHSYKFKSINGKGVIKITAKQTVNAHKVSVFKIMKQTINHVWRYVKNICNGF